jgi:DNA-binding transcriptional regulator YiaG
MRAAERIKPVIETVFIQEIYPECRVAARVPMRRNPETGELSYTGTAMRTLDRLRSVIQDVTASSTSGHIVSLREALGMTQQQFATRLKVTSQTVSRWERGEVRPNERALAAMRRLQATARRKGIAVPLAKPRKGGKRSSPSA